MSITKKFLTGDYRPIKTYTVFIILNIILLVVLWALFSAFHFLNVLEDICGFYFVTWALVAYIFLHLSYVIAVYNLSLKYNKLKRYAILLSFYGTTFLVGICFVQAFDAVAKCSI